MTILSDFAPRRKSTDLDCPICAATMSYSSTTARVVCQVCGWQTVLSEEENGDLLFAILGLNGVDAGLLLRSVRAHQQVTRLEGTVAA